MSYLARKRLDVPEVHRLLAALDTMLDDWAETDAGSPERLDLWRRTYGAADELSQRAYGHSALLHRIGYWLRPYDPKRDARCWRWRRLPCYVLALPGGTTDTRDRTTGAHGGAQGDSGPSDATCRSDIAHGGSDAGQ